MGLFSAFISLEADIIYYCIEALFSPVKAIFSIFSVLHTGAKSTKSKVLSFPMKLAENGFVLLRKLAVGTLAAAQVLSVLLAVMVVAVILGIGSVKLYTEEAIAHKESLFFDYTLINPQSAVDFSSRPTSGMERFKIPVGHACHISLLLKMPESHFNRELGIFQIRMEVLSKNGTVIARCSKPKMLRFRSLPVRLLRLSVRAIPLALGVWEETQVLHVPMLSFKESSTRTKSVRVIVAPRSGSSSLPQFYEAELIVRTELPWRKQIARDWRWTLYVWASIDAFLLLVAMMLFCFKPILMLSDDIQRYKKHEVELIEDELSEFLKGWKIGREKYAGSEDLDSHDSTTLSDRGYVSESVDSS